MRAGGNLQVWFRTPGDWAGHGTAGGMKAAEAAEAFLVRSLADALGAAGFGLERPAHLDGVTRCELRCGVESIVVDCACVTLRYGGGEGVHSPLEWVLEPGMGPLATERAVEVTLAALPRLQDIRAALITALAQCVPEASLMDGQVGHTPLVERS